MLKLFLILHHCFALSVSDLPLKPETQKQISRGEIISISKVNSYQNKANKLERQNLNFQIYGLHPRSCRLALRKISRYENFSKWVDFIKTSEYNDQTHLVYFVLSHSLMPFDMELEFEIPRITTTGSYPFIFSRGLLKNLKGTIDVYEDRGQCLFVTKAIWDGDKTKIPDSVFEFFTQALSKKSMEIIFRISSN